MTHDPFRSPTRTDPARSHPPYGAEDRAVIMSWTVTALAIAVILAGLAVYSRSGPTVERNSTAATQRPVITGTPRLPPMIEDETTGRATPR
jgi:hypothetical protein